MRVTYLSVRPLPVLALFSGSFCPSVVHAQAGFGFPGPGGLALMFALALIAALVSIFSYRRRLAEAQAQKAALADRLALMDAVSGLRAEHAIIWPFDGTDEIVTEGFGALLEIEASPDDRSGGWYRALRGLMSDEDAASLDQSVASLRSARTPFSLPLGTADGSRSFSLRGDCVVADG